MKYTLEAGTGHINFSPVGFRLAAKDFLACYEDYKPDRFSVVPYFLCCRAIELGLKAIHLDKKRQREVKDEFGHSLKASYDALPVEQRILSKPEVEAPRR